MSNDHLRNTHTFLNEATDGMVWSPEQQPTVATLAVAEATLALAYEQRTANLIAFERAQWDAWRQDELNPEGVDLWRRAAEQVNERLGLG